MSAETNTMDLDSVTDMSASVILDSGELTPVRSASPREVPGAPRRRPRSPSEEAELAAYDAVVRELATELQARLGDLPPAPVGEPSGLERQQACDSSAPRVCSPVTMESPAALYVVGAARQVSAELDLAGRAELPMASTGRAELPMASTERAESPLKRRETDIEGDLSVAAVAAVAESNVPELPALPAMDEGEETEEVSDDGESDEEAVSGGEEADTEGDDAAVVEHVETEAADTNTDGLNLSFHRQKGGDLALRLEAPVWMLGVLMSVVTAYMWMVAYLIKNK